MEKFRDPLITAKGEPRASVELKALKTLWFNTGTRCNLSCENCYIESNPKNDRLSFLIAEDVYPYLDEIKEEGLATEEIGFTGGEPFLNPHIMELVELSLERGFQTLVLTNAYRINRYKDDLVRLGELYGNKLIIRVSLDHYTKDIHEKERGQETFEPTLKNCQWLSQQSLQLTLAGRSLSGEDQVEVRQGYEALIDQYDIALDLNKTESLVIFPEMDMDKQVPEITTACWGILNKSPDDIMCSSSRMIVKRKGQTKPRVLACTLLAYDPQFELGETLKLSKNKVQLNHPFCAQFCVLGGSSCS